MKTTTAWVPCLSIWTLCTPKTRTAGPAPGSVSVVTDRHNPAPWAPWTSWTCSTTASSADPPASGGADGRMLTVSAPMRKPSPAGATNEAQYLAPLSQASRTRSR